MRLAPVSHKKIEEFFRQYFGEDDLRLPPIMIYSGFWANLLTKTFKLNGITFGRRIFIDRAFVRRDENGLPFAPFDLIVHEATHVVQYQKEGFFGFLLSYLKEWIKFIREQGSRNIETRWQAYYALRHETEARAAAAAFAEWRAKLSLESDE